ncbi:hypothetical protein [Burkholderia cepacia]|uniref:hypothetical protein n=1 Tax=Burkholderia cepacia TaxID=292 RepID=UPI001CF1B370|nr:hypothetical protein [Burkholderia cepacia]MCA8111355.1 hypothetical protein [Burkholderia cepacia]
MSFRVPMTRPPTLQSDSTGHASGQVEDLTARQLCSAIDRQIEVRFAIEMLFVRIGIGDISKSLENERLAVPQPYRHELHRLIECRRSP